MNASVALAIGTTITTLAALTTLLILFSKTANSALYAIENNDNSGGSGDQDDDNDGGDYDDDNHWWDRENFDLKREEQATLKIALNTLVLCIACATLFVPMTKIWHPSKGLYDRFNMGVLAASTFLVGNMMFVSFWYSANFFGEEEDENDNNDDKNDDNNDDDGNNDDAYEMDEEELLAYHQKLISTTSLVLALAFSALSICIYAVGKKLPETGRHYSGNSNSGSETTSTYAQAKSAAHMELFSEMWKWLTSCTIAIFSLLFLVACGLSLGEDAERRNEEGDGNIIIVLLWMIIVTTGLLVMGRNSLGERKLNGTFGLGMLSGGTIYFALLLFVVFILYLSVEMRREDGAGLAMSIACFFLSMMYLAFSLGTYKYQDSFIGGITEEDSSKQRDSTRSIGDFQRMEDDESEMESVVELT